MVHFPVSGVDVFPLLPPLIAFAISFFTSMGGVSGAFLLLPFQVSVLGFTSPAVSPTNLVYNMVGTPSGVYRYIKEGRMAWPLALVIILGIIPGMIAGVIIRIKYLPDPAAFKFFAGLILLFIGGQLLFQVTGKYRKGEEKLKVIENKFKERVKKSKDDSSRFTSGLAPEAVVKTLRLSIKTYEYEFWGEKFSFNTMKLLLFALFVGIISGTYGIGGGSLIVPFCVARLGLPVYTVAGAALFSTFAASVLGISFYYIAGMMLETTSFSVAPDWPLGLLFGIGGILGMYCGARAQKYFPERLIRIILGTLITFLALKYILQYFN